jgi:formylglycine-generating enzyme required for sulfatase activity
MSDHCPAGGARLRALLEAQAHGIVLELESAADTLHGDLLLSRMASHLFEEAGLRQDLCVWAVETWHLALTPRVVNAALAESRTPQMETPQRSSTPSVLQQPGDPQTVDLGAGVKMEMVWLLPGEFDMGSNERENAKPVHRVRLTQGFWMGKYEVTQEQWERVMGNNPSRFKAAHNPVENVSWHDCQKFLKKLNSEVRGRRPGGGLFRLPTEAEWEYACRAGTTTRFHNGDEERGLGDVAWYRENSGDTTHPVGQKKPNAWGLHDMHGNVWEWCHDRYGGYRAGGVTDPTGPWTGSYRVLRGGSWLYAAFYCRAGGRSGVDPCNAHNLYGLGFRAALPPGQ